MENKLTIIIPHLGTKPEQCYALNQCFQSLRETAPDIPVLVAKNGPIACRCIRHIRVLSQGQCKAVNAAIATTNTPYVMVTNDDMIYPPGWVEDLFFPFQDKGIPPCLSPQLVEPHKGAPTFIEYFCGGAGGDFDKQKFYEFVKNQPDDRMVRPGFNLPFVMDRRLWNTVGGYDVNYDPWGSNSDSDLEYKVKLAGVQPMQTTSCLVYHFSQTSGTFEPRHQDAWSRNWDYFIEKWGFPRTDEGIWQATFTIPDEGRIFRPEWEGKYGH